MCQNDVKRASEALIECYSDMLILKDFERFYDKYPNHPSRYIWDKTCKNFPSYF